MFATFDLVVDKVDSVDGMDRPHVRPLRFSIFAMCDLKISMFAMFDLVVDKVDSVDGVDRPHERPLRISIPLI